MQGAACDQMGFHLELQQDFSSPRRHSLPDSPSPAHRDPGPSSEQQSRSSWRHHISRIEPMHYAKVVKTGFEVVNFDKKIRHKFSTKISQIFHNDVKTSKYLTK